MDMDLSRALHDAAQTGTAHRPPIASGPVLQRIRRRRNARIAVESTVGVAAAGAVAVGAVQATSMRSPDPLPAAPTTASPTPTPTPSRSDARVLPAAVTATSPFACDLPAPVVTDPAGDAELRFEPALAVSGDDGGSRPVAPVGGGIAVTPGQTLSVDPVLVNGSADPVDAVGTGGPEVWLVQEDGTVSGRLQTTAADPAETAYTGAPGAQFTSEQLTGTLVGCAADGSTAEPLPVGTYRLYVVQEVRVPGGEPQLVTGPAAPVTVAAPVEEEPEVPPAPPTTPAEPEPGLHPDLEDLVISPAGLGPLAVGVPPASNPGAAMVEVDPDFCDPELFPDTQPARWVPSGYPEEDFFGEPRPPFDVEADDDGVKRIDVLGPTIRTAEGIGNGSTVAELQAAYPQLEGPLEGVMSRVWWLTGPTGSLAFETQARDADGNLSADEPERVIIMRVTEAGIDPRFHTANSGDVAGGC